VLPCYNEEKNLKQLVSAIDDTVGRHMPYRIVAVDDGSFDNTGHLLRALSKEYPITVLGHERNMGLASTLSDGLSAAMVLSQRDDLIVTMDSDNTHDPRYILDMAKSTVDADVVVGSRYVYGGRQMNVPIHRVLLSKVVNLLIREVTRVPAKDATSGFRCFKASSLKRTKSVFDDGLVESKGFEVSLEILLKAFWCNAKIKEVPIMLDYGRKSGASKMKLMPTIKRYFNVLYRISKWKKELPLQYD
jgi:dolichol-phosphate mannosyltransferase